MATIPLPALSINTQQESPLAAYAKIQQIQAAQTQQQTAALQQTGLEQENQQRALALKDQQTLRSIAPNHLQKDADGNVTGFDTEGLLKEAAGKGVNPDTLNKMRLGYADTVSKLATADKETRDNEQARNKTLYETLESVRGIKDPQQRQAALIQSLPTLKKQGVDISKIQANQPITDDMLNFDEAGLGMHAQMLTDAKTQSEVVANQARKTAADTGALRLQAELPGGALSPAAREAQRIAAENSPEAIAGAARKAGAETTARQTAAQGDPNTAGHMLANGSLTLADLKSRGTTPQFITQAVAAAQKEKSSYNPADEVIAESVAKSQGANQFFGSANSLIAKGGTLDQLEAQGKKIPNEKMPILNTFEDWQQLAKGKGPLAGYAATALGVADDYGKVMGGGTASDHARDAALRLFAAASSPEMRADAIKATRDAVGSQRDSRIGNNQFLKRLYGDQPSKGNTGAAPSGHVIAIGGKNYQYKGSGDTADLKNYSEVEKH